MTDKEALIPVPFEQEIRRAEEAQQQYLRSGDPTALDQAALAWGRVLNDAAFADLEEPVQLAAQNAAGGIYLQLYWTRGQPDDLNQAVSLWQDTVARVPADSPDRPIYLSSLGGGLHERYMRTGRLEDLEQAIRVYQEAVASAPPDSPDQPIYLSSLGNGLYLRYLRTGRLEDLEQAICAYQEAVANTPPDSPDRPGTLNNLGAGLRARYTRTGRLEDLEAAIHAFQEAATLTPPDSADRSLYVNNLGNELRARYARTGQLEDLEEALRAYQEAVARALPDSPRRPMYLNNLGTGLSNRYARTGQLEDLEEAIRLYQEAVDRTPPDSPERPLYLNNLGNGLRIRYEGTGRLEDLEAAIGACQEAVAHTPADSPERPRRLINLANGLLARYARDERLEDLEEAIRAYREAASRTAADSPDGPALLNNLAGALRARFKHTGQPEDLKEGILVYEESTRLGDKLSLEGSLRAARNWGNWALERQAWDEATRAYSYGLQASERLFQEQLLRASKESWLREARGLHARAAYALAQTGDLSQAAEALERGRARLLAEVLERDRAELGELGDIAPEAYQQYASASERLRLLEGQELGGQMVLPEGQSLADAIRQARADLEAAVQDIRQVPSYEAFLQLPTFAQIKSAVEPGCPLVYLALTPTGTVALIVSQEDPDNSSVRPVWIELTEDALRERVLGPADASELGGYLGSYARWRPSPGDRATRTAWFAALDETCHWLWDALMGPLVEALTGIGVDRAVLIPQGWLGLLPLHAGWTETHVPGTSEVPGTHGRRYAMDEVSFTYAPNARALLAARETAARVEPDRLLAVDNPDGSLRYAALEVRGASERFDPFEVLSGESTTRNAVLRRLRDHAVLHFSCHGQAGFDQPLEGGLLMAHDERLTLRDILGLRLENARLAILSACETGIPGTELPDEVVSLPTGLVQAGVAGVVASLWPVSDLSTMMLMVRFYDEWMGEGLQPPEALRRAQRWVRDTTNGGKVAYLAAKFGDEHLPASSAWSRPDENDFAHPVYWAAFGYTGA